MVNEIRLIDRGTGYWHAKYTGPHASEIQQLFGVDTLPTPYRLKFPDVALAEIRQRNPDVSVELA